LKVPEVWRCTEKTIQINLLQNGEYVRSEYSAVFPMVSAAMIKEFLEQGRTSDDDNAVIRSLRRWITEQEHPICNRSGGDQKNVQYEITRNQYENQSRLDLYRIIVSSQKCYTGLQIVF